MPRPQRWMALVGAGCTHGSPSLPLNHTVGHAIGRRLAATAPGVSKKPSHYALRELHHRDSGDAHVTGKNPLSVGVCFRVCARRLCVCLWGWGGGQSACWPDVILNRCVLVTVSKDHVRFQHHHRLLRHCHHDSPQQRARRLFLAPCRLPLLLRILSGLVVYQVVSPSLRSRSCSCCTLVCAVLTDKQRPFPVTSWSRSLLHSYRCYCLGRPIPPARYTPPTPRAWLPS